MTTNRKTHFATLQVERETHDIIRKLSIFTKKPAHKVVKALLAYSKIIDQKHDDIFFDWSEETYKKFIIVSDLIE